MLTPLGIPLNGDVQNCTTHLVKSREKARARFTSIKNRRIFMISTKLVIFLASS